MYRNFLTVLFGACFLFFSTGLVGAEEIKIGVIDFQKVVQTSAAGKAAQEEVNEKGKQMEADLLKRKNEIEESQKNLERETMVMAPEAREEREREIRIRVNDFKTLQQKYFNDLKTHEGKLIRAIRDEIIRLGQEIGKKKGYTLLLEKQEAGTIYYKEDLEITDELIQMYDEQYKKSKSAKGKP
jgi:outer membrane protein